MNSVDKIFDFLRDVAVHNSREWFADNRDRYEEARAEFEARVQQIINRIALFDPSVAHVTVKDSTYRFYRDTRFSPDKSPYKRHLGAYINARGKKSFHGGYYFHLEPGACMLAGGSYCLPSPQLKAVRETVEERLDEFRSIVEQPDFRACFPVIGMERLKTLPKGFPKDFPCPEYLRPKDYSVAFCVPDDLFRSEGWLDETERVFRLLKPFLDFVNEPIDDFE
ncbi:MAG: DUF2461 domain-containing protein [Clostridium sp.]|nr:DUF2461 domain-containing protein [Clostridium sp.]